MSWEDAVGLAIFLPLVILIWACVIALIWTLIKLR